MCVSAICGDHERMIYGFVHCSLNLSTRQPQAMTHGIHEAKAVAIAQDAIPSVPPAYEI
jgi:hypothetical protein